MKLSLLTGIITILIYSNGYSQHLECQKFKNGYFKIPGDSISPVSYIKRSENTQIENIKGKYISSEFQVKWITPCTYELTPTEKTLLQFEGLPKNAVLTVQIIETKGNSYLQKSTGNFGDFEIITEVIRTDSTEFKNHLKQNSLNDSIIGQIKIAEELKTYMNAKKYEEAISLFSLNQQENIRKLQKDKEMFKYWIQAWTLDDAQLERYINKIKTGKAYFVLEDNEWKINEK